MSTDYTLKTLVRKSKMFNHLYRWFVLCLLLGCPILSYPTLAQQNTLIFEQITVEDGLLDGWVHDVLMDKKGVIWLATHDGLGRFDGVNFKNYRYNKREKDALPGSVLMDIKEGHNDIYWIACNGIGLIRFDAKTEKFKPYPHNPADPLSISGVAATTVHVDKEQNVWVGTFDEGLNLFNSEEETFTRYPLSEFSSEQGDRFMNNSVRDIIDDPDDINKLWLATHQGIIHFDKRTGVMEKHLLVRDNEAAFTSCFIKNEMIWIASDNAGLIEFDPKTKTSRFHYPNIPFSGVQPKSKNELWLSTRSNGLSIFNTDSRQISFIDTDAENDNSLLSNFIDGIYVDPNGRLWIRDIDKGLSITSGKAAYFNRPVIDPEIYQNLKGIKKFAFHQGDQQLYLGIVNSPDLYLFDKIDNNYHYDRILRLPEEIPGIPTLLMNIEINPTGTIYILCLSKDKLFLYRYDPTADSFASVPCPALINASITSELFASMTTDKSGQLWISLPKGQMIAVQDSQVNAFQIESNHPVDKYPYFSGIKADHANHLWITSYNDGVFRYNIATGEDTHFPFDTSVNGLDAWRILSITEIEEGKMWVGTSASGIQQIDAKLPPNQFMPSYDQRNGLPDNKIFGLETDSMSRVWIATLRGLVRYDQQEKRFRHFTQRDGLSNTSLKYGFALVDERDIMIGHPTGFQYLISRKEKNIEQSSVVRIMDLEVNGKPYHTNPDIPYLNKLVLGPDENYFTIGFSALQYENQEDIRYRYILDSYDPYMRETEEGEAEVSYTNLPPGDYKFKIQSSNHKGEFNSAVTELSIRINPHWYESTLAKFIYAFLLIGGIGFWLNQKRQAIVLENKRKEEQLKLLEQKVKERTQEIVHQKEQIEDQHLLLTQQHLDLEAEQNKTQQMLLKIENLFGQQVSKDVARELIDSEGTLSGKKYEVTIMFLDIRNFSSYADATPVEEVLAFQNTLFGQLMEIVQQHQGVTNQLLGDGFMAVFGAPAPTERHAHHAVAASLATLEKAKQLADSGIIKPVRLGIGLHSGDVVAGNIGNNYRQQYSITGTTVIIASRIEQLNKKQASQLLISKEVQRFVQHKDAISIGKIPLKGIADAIEVYKLA